MKRFDRNQKGFTLIELLVAIPIAGIVVLASTAGIIQLMHSRDIDAGVLAIRQVQTAGNWVMRDGVQAQQVIINSDDGFPLVLKWTRYDTNQSYEVSYSLVSAGAGGLMNLERTETINGGNPSTHMVGQYLVVDGRSTSCWWEPVQSGLPREFTIRLTADVGQTREFREYTVKPRVL